MAAAKKPRRGRRAPRLRPPGGRRSAHEGRAVFAHVPAEDVDHDHITIVGVGASAGGLEAFTALLKSLPEEPNIAIVFVQHLAPRHDSALVPLLTGQSTLPVLQAAHGMDVEVNHIYVIPPNAQLEIAGRTLQLNARPDDRSQYTPVDTFFSSLAEAAGAHAVGVILSGTASDGSLGLRAIKGAGGVAIAQLPESAKYDGMPRAALATGMVDLVLPPDAMGRKLAELSHYVYARSREKIAAEAPITDEQLHQLFDILRPTSGVDFRHYKQPTIRRRLFRRMALHRLSAVADYLRLLRSDPGEVRSLYQDILIHVTRFFREPESFDALAREVFPAIAQGHSSDRPIRAWVSGCATGEEAYSLAIVLVEYLQRSQLDIPVQIFGTDVSETAVDHARAGVFQASIEADVGPDRLRKFFTKHDGGYRVTKMIRNLCVFARQDLTKDPPFSRLDLIMCRNVLIYLDATLQKKLLSVFHYALNPNGFLVLGQAESVGAQVMLFSVVDKKFHIHRKKTTTSAAAMSFPADYSGAVPRVKKTSIEPAAPDKHLQTEVSRVLMDRFAPPGVVVDVDMQIVQFRGQTGPYLEPAPGEASLNLLKMAKEGLLYGLRTAIHAARKTRNAVHRDGLRVRTANGWKPVSLEVIPLSETGRVHYLVLFGEGRRPASGRKQSAATPPAPRLARRERETQVDFLQKELAASREYLQSIIQELEAANEELQSANEEIVSSNEELQSTNEELDTAKEELQSTNEELNTVNEELHARNEELSRLNSDLVNLLGSVQIAIVIVNADLRIRRFTPMAERVLNLIPTDVDRLITHINPNIISANLGELITECIDSMALIEREVQDHQGHWFALRIRPYRVENKIDGAVVALFDIDSPKRHEEALRSVASLADAVAQASNAPVAIVDTELIVRSASPRFVELFSMPAGRWRNRPLTDFTRADDLATFRDLVQGIGTPTAERRAIELPQTDGRRAITLRVRAYSSFDDIKRRVLLITAEEGLPPAPGQ
jgi:two-component system, chemotaxis family, CheB/CheR fusion protein